MKDLTNNEKLQLARLKSFSNCKDEFKKLPKEIQKSFIDKGYYDDLHNFLTIKAYESYSEWFENEYIGSKKEKLDHDSRS